MKTMKAMKTMKVMKMAKKDFAYGHGAKARVFFGKKKMTSGRLTADKLMRNKSGKVVSMASSLHAKKMYPRNGLKTWVDAVKKAREELGLTGFVVVGGKSAAGKALLNKIRELL